MAKYEIRFECIVTIEARNASEAIKKAWLTDNLNYHGVYEYKDVKKVPDTAKGG